MARSSIPKFDAFSDEKNPYRARGFCGALSKGKTQSIRSEYIEDFMPFIKRAQISWVDYIVEDFEKDALATAIKLGFSETLVKALLKNVRSGYEDFDTEMGILLPAIHVKGFEVVLEPQVILIKKDLILTVHTRETTRFSHIRRYSETFMKKLPRSMPQVDKLTMILIRILDASNSN